MSVISSAASMPNSTRVGARFPSKSSSSSAAGGSKRCSPDLCEGQARQAKKQNKRRPATKETRGGAGLNIAWRRDRWRSHTRRCRSSTLSPSRRPVALTRTHTTLQVSMVRSRTITRSPACEAAGSVQDGSSLNQRRPVQTTHERRAIGWCPAPALETPGL